MSKVIKTLARPHMGRAERHAVAAIVSVKSMFAVT